MKVIVLAITTLLTVSEGYTVFSMNENSVRQLASGSRVSRSELIPIPVHLLFSSKRHAEVATKAAGLFPQFRGGYGPHCTMASA